VVLVQPLELAHVSAQQLRPGPTNAPMKEKNTIRYAQLSGSCISPVSVLIGMIGRRAAVRRRCREEAARHTETQWPRGRSTRT